MSLKFGFIKIKLYPIKNKQSTDKDDKPKEQKEYYTPKKNKKEKKQFSLKNIDINGLMDKLLNFIYDLNGKIYFDRLNLNIIFASSDAAKTGLMLGFGFSFFGLIIPIIKQNFCIKNDAIILDADFDKTKPTISADIIAHIRLISILLVFIRYIPYSLKLYNDLKIKT